MFDVWLSHRNWRMLRNSKRTKTEKGPETQNENCKPPTKFFRHKQTARHTGTHSIDHKSVSTPVWISKTTKTGYLGSCGLSNLTNEKWLTDWLTDQLSKWQNEELTDWQTSNVNDVINWITSQEEEMRWEWWRGRGYVQCDTGLDRGYILRYCAACCS